MFKLRNISFSNFIFKKNKLLDISKYSSTNYTNAFPFSTNNNDSNKNNHKREESKNKGDSKTASPPKRVIILKKAENTASDKPQQIKIESESKVKQQETPKEIPTMKKKEIKQTPTLKVQDQSSIKEETKKPQTLKQEKTPITMKKKEEPKKIKSTIIKELNYKQVVHKQTTENFHHLFNNSSIVKLIREYSNLYSDNLEKKYIKVLKEIIREKVNNIENEINSMKEIYNKSKDSKMNYEEFSFKDNSQKIENKNNKGEFRDIFDLNVNTMKDIKEKIKVLPKDIVESVKFNVEYADFYLNVDIDKSFEIFKENISNKSISKDMKSLLEEFTKNFVFRIYELDRLVYLPELIRFVEENKINISASPKLIKLVQTNSINYTSSDSFNYKALILNFKLLNLIITEKTTDEIIKSITDIFENSIFQITTFKISNKIIHKEIEEDEIFSLNKLLDVVTKSESDNQKSIESLHKIFALYYEDKNFLDTLYQNYILNNYELVRVLKNNLEAYYNNFGFLPNGFNEEKVIEYYYKNMRSKLNLFKNYSDKKFSKEAYIFYILLQKHGLKELQADFISLFEKNSKNNENMENSLKFYYCDFILNNNLDGKHYYENIEKVYPKKLNIEDKHFATQALMQTLAYLKDGNSEFAINNIFKSIEKRVEFIKNNDKELLNLINTITNPESLNSENNTGSQEVYINLNADFLPFIEEIKVNFDDLLSYELTFKTNNNIMLAKENIIDRLFDKKTLNDTISANEDSNKSKKEESDKNYYNEKLNKIIYNINQIKILYQKKESEYLNSLRPLNKKKIGSEMNNHLDEMKVYIYSIFEDTWKFYNDISKYLRMNFNRIEDFENLKFSTNESKENLLRNIERKIRELGNYRTLTYENKKLLRFYKNFFAYAESIPLSVSSDVILSEDMLNYIQNPQFILEKQIDDQEYIGKARNYFSEYYKKVQKKFPKQNFFVLENLDFLKNNLKIDLENFVVKYKTEITENEIPTENLNTLKNKIEFYVKNLEFVKQIISKIPDFDVNYTKQEIHIDKKDAVLKKLILFEAENLAKYKNLNTKGNLITENRPNHLIEQYLSSFTGRLNKKLLLSYNNGSLNKMTNKNRYPFKSINDKNLFKMMMTLNSQKNEDKNIFNTLAEKIIVPKISSKKIGVSKNILSQLLNLEESITGKTNDRSYAVNEIYGEFLNKMNIHFNKPNEANEALSGEESNRASKLKEIKETIDQNFDIFDLNGCVYMIEFGVEHNIANAIRLGEKLCSDFGFVLPNHIQNKVNRYLITNSEDYAKATEKIYPVDLAKIYNNSKDLSISDNIENVYDDYMNPTSIWAIDKLPFKGLEMIYDFKKFSNVIRHINLKH